jgi:uncharacterized Zn finger protein (UPF0148 family)
MAKGDFMHCPCGGGAWKIMNNGAIICVNCKSSRGFIEQTPSVAPIKKPAQPIEPQETELPEKYTAAWVRYQLV